MNVNISSEGYLMVAPSTSIIVTEASPSPSPSDAPVSKRRKASQAAISREEIELEILHHEKMKYQEERELIALQKELIKLKIAKLKCTKCNCEANHNNEL